MAQTIKPLYGTGGQAITVTLASLGSGSARASTAVDNTTNLFVDALLQVKVKVGTVVAPSYVNIYAYATVDGGTSYSDSITGTDAAYTISNPSNLVLIDSIYCPTNTATFISSPRSIAAAFGGVLPQKWGIVVENKTGAALDATAGNFLAQYQGVQMQAV